ncbi:MAG: hypothetical protein Q9227_003189 [Pyrenula ochraceoflavens]
MSEKDLAPRPGHLEPTQTTQQDPNKLSTSHLLQSTSTTPRISREDTKPEISRSNSRSSSISSRIPSLEIERDPEKGLKEIESHAGSRTNAGPAVPSQTRSPTKDPNLVEFDGPDDPENPMNWSKAKKWILTMSLGFMTFNVTLASSIFSTATTVVSEKFHIGLEVSTLGTSLFVLGFAFGPLIWGPLSELYGRMIPLFGAFSCFIIMQIPVGVAINVETIMICRFLGGVFACAPLAIVGGCLADFWDPVMRGVSVTSFAGAVFIGPVFGPILGGFITQSHLGWRWTAWITMISGGFFGLIALFFASETYAPVILQRKAARLRHETRNWALHAPRDENRVTMSDIATRYLTRPFAMMVQEPILLLITIYMSLVYGKPVPIDSFCTLLTRNFVGIVYLLFEAFPITFQEKRGWNLGVGALPFLSIIVGVRISSHISAILPFMFSFSTADPRPIQVLLGGSYVIYETRTTFARKMRENNGRVIPEDRLPSMILGGCLLPIGLFWFAWTSSPHITWVPQVLAGIPIGAGVFIIFMSSFTYIIDVYLMLANSAIAGNTFLRSLAGAGFPLFAVQMYDKLGVAWASSLLAFLCCVMVPIPVLFWLYGAKVRSWSKFSPKF